jgi:hypothetical protein
MELDYYTYFFGIPNDLEANSTVTAVTKRYNILHNIAFQFTSQSPLYAVLCGSSVCFFENC